MAVTLTTYRLADGATRPTVVAINVPEARANLPYPVQRRVELMFKPGEVMATTYDLSGWVANHVLVVVPPRAPMTPALVGVLEADPIVVSEVAAPVIVPIAEPIAEPIAVAVEAPAVEAVEIVEIAEIAEASAPVVEPVVETIPEPATPTAPAPAALRALRQRGRK
jgi:hypothetical protein